MGNGHLQAKVIKVFAGRHFVQLHVLQGTLYRDDSLCFMGSEASGVSHISVHRAHEIQVENKPAKHVGAGKKCVIMIDPTQPLPPQGSMVFLAT